MIYRFLLVAIILIGFFVLVYKLLTHEPKSIKSKTADWLNPFNKPIFKIPVGVLIILGTIIWSFKLVKSIPMVEKIGLIGLDFIIIYTVINYLFNKNKKTN